MPAPEEPAPQIIRVIGIDASTVDTGVALLEIDVANCLSQRGVVVRHWMRFGIPSSKPTIDERFRRLRSARKDLSLFLAGLPEIHLVGYEDPPPNAPGRTSTDALHQAIGMFLGLGKFEDIPVYAVHAATVKKEQGTSKLATSSVDKTVRGATEAKRKELKRLGIEWANRRVTLNAPLTDQDAISDAIAVGMGAFHKWQDEQYLKEREAAGQGKLTLRKTPTRRTTATK